MILKKMMQRLLEEENKLKILTKKSMMEVEEEGSKWEDEMKSRKGFEGQQKAVASDTREG